MVAFRQKPKKFRLIGRDTIATGIQETYTFKNDTIQLYSDYNLILLSNPKSGWAVDSIRPGDPESKLLEKYPVSTQAPIYYHTRFEDIKRMYYYMVWLYNRNGDIKYFIKDKTVEKIEFEISQP